mmetsp:Transcript_2181/g.3214  ORF Transcript_2181/g.3214 Transcript_2181/m.3214 type:complete len:97 (+) Transcript_2181:1618-1908(+)
MACPPSITLKLGSGPLALAPVLMDWAGNAFFALLCQTPTHLPLGFARAAKVCSVRKLGSIMVVVILIVAGGGKRCLVSSKPNYPCMHTSLLFGNKS